MISDIVKFINGSEYTCTIVKVNNHVIRLIFSLEAIPTDNEITGGFYVYNHWNKELQGDFSAYTTLYREYPDRFTYELSDDQSIYIPPDPGISQPEDPLLTLEQTKVRKIDELSSICKTNIETGVEVEINGKMEHFYYNLSDGDQEDIDSLFTAAVTTRMGQSYHCHNGNCRIYSVEEIVSIYVAQKTNTMHHKTYFNQLRQYINSFADNEAIGSIENITYGQPLTGIYLDTYNLNMENAQNVIQATLEIYGLNG